MMRAGLAGWPLWISVGVHVAGLATASSVVALARHEPERVLVPVELVRVEPPPPEPPKPPRVIPRQSPVVRSTPITQTLMQPDPTPQPVRPEPVADRPRPPLHGVGQRAWPRAGDTGRRRARAGSCSPRPRSRAPRRARALAPTWRAAPARVSPRSPAARCDQ